MNSILTLQANHRVLPYSYRYRNPYDWRASASRGSDQWQSQESTYTGGIEPQSRLGMDESPTIGAAIFVFSMPKEMIVIVTLSQLLVLTPWEQHDMEPQQEESRRSEHHLPPPSQDFRVPR